MSVTDIKNRIQQITQAGRLTVADVDALYTAAGTIKLKEEQAIRKAIDSFTGTKEPDAMTRFNEQFGMLTQLRDEARQNNRAVKRARPQLEAHMKERLTPGTATTTFGGTAIPEAVKKVVNDAIAAGAIAYDVRALKSDPVFDTGHGESTFTLTGEFNPYSQEQEAVDSMTFENTELTPKKVTTDMATTQTWDEIDGYTESSQQQAARFKQVTGNPNGRITELYDEASWSNTMARGPGGQKYASNFAILADGSVHAVPASRRTAAEPWRILTAASLGRGELMLFNGHLHMENGVVTGIGRAGRLKDFKLVDALEILKAWGFEIAPHVTVQQAEQSSDVKGADRAHISAPVGAAALSWPARLAVGLARRGDFCLRHNQIQVAVRLYEQAVKVLAAAPGTDLVELLHSMDGAQKAIRHGAFEAPDFFMPEIGDVLTDEERDPALVVKLILRVANAYLEQPQDAVAKARYLDALARPEMAGRPLLQAHARAAVALIERRAGEIEQAAATLQEATARFNEAGAAQVERRRALLVQAGIERARGDAATALGTLRAAVALYVEAKDGRGEARALTALGDAALSGGSLEEASASFQRSLELARAGDDTDTIAVAALGAGRCLHRAGRIADAVTALEQGLAALEEHADTLRTEEGKVTFLEGAMGAYDELVALRLDGVQQRIATWQDVLTTIERAGGRALADLMGVRSRQRPQVLVDVPPDPEGALAVRAGGRLQHQDAPARSVAPLPRLVFYALENRTAVLVVPATGEVIGHVVASGHDAWANRVAALRKALDVDAAPRGVRFAGDPGPQVPSPGLPAAVAPATPTSAAPAAVGAIPPTKNRPVHADLDRHVVALGGASDAAFSPGDALDALGSIYKELLAPVEAALPGDAPLAVEPHGPFWLLPFAALRRADGTWLGDRAPLVLSPSASILNEIRNEPAPPPPAALPALVVGDPVMPADTQVGHIVLGPLPGALAEANAVAARFAPGRCVLLKGAEASRETVQAELPRRGIIHFATHGLALADDPLASFVVLAEPPAGRSLLTARDVLDLSLNQLQLAPNDVTPPSLLPAGIAPMPRVPGDDANDGGGGGEAKGEGAIEPPLAPTATADLVVLSACQTGLGRVTGDGVIGLSRAFLAAGARTVVASLWSVDDGATCALMKAFYERYLATGDKARALQYAAATVRAVPAWAAPRYWAPFVLIGAES